MAGACMRRSSLITHLDGGYDHSRYVSIHINSITWNYQYLPMLMARIYRPSCTCPTKSLLLYVPGTCTSYWNTWYCIHINGYRVKLMKQSWFHALYRQLAENTPVHRFMAFFARYCEHDWTFRDRTPQRTGELMSSNSIKLIIYIFFRRRCWLNINPTPPRTKKKKIRTQEKRKGTAVRFPPLPI